jgi:hypothetical protein
MARQDCFQHSQTVDAVRLGCDALAHCIVEAGNCAGEGGCGRQAQAGFLVVATQI